MSKKKIAASKDKKRFSNKQLLLISTVIASVIIIGSVLSFMLLQTPNKFSLNAVIIDQCGEVEYSNPEFVANVTDILKTTGFKVTYYERKSVNVTFFSGLAKGDYGIIVLRVHSALRKDNSTVDFFTSEEFSENKYNQMVEDGLLTRGNYLWEPGKYYFAITPRFIEELEGRFPRSVVIAMGCWSLSEGCEEMADAFRKKGAEVYIGWTGSVDPAHTDKETIKLLKMLLSDNRTIDYAVQRIIPDYAFPPGSKMRYYPETVGSLKISDLIAEAKASLNLQGIMTFSKLTPIFCVSRFAMFKPRKEFRFGLSTTLSALKQLHTTGCEESHLTD